MADHDKIMDATISAIRILDDAILPGSQLLDLIPPCRMRRSVLAVKHANAHLRSALPSGMVPRRNLPPYSSQVKAAGEGDARAALQRGEGADSRRFHLIALRVINAVQAEGTAPPSWAKELIESATNEEEEKYAEGVTAMAFSGSCCGMSAC